jgi:hypothetical protein
MRARGGGLMPASLCVAPTGLCLPSTLLRRYARADISRPTGAHAIAQSPKLQCEI